MQQGCFSRSWEAFRSTEGWFAKICVLALVAFIPILGPIVVSGYLLGWARDAAWGMDNPLPRKVFGNEDGRLYRHLRYTYTYDTENRVTSKEASKWDSSKEAWVPYFKMDVSYANNEVELSYARWNSKSNAYDSSIKKTIYEMNDDNVTLMLASTK